MPTVRAAFPFLVELPTVEESLGLDLRGDLDALRRRDDWQQTADAIAKAMVRFEDRPVGDLLPGLRDWNVQIPSHLLRTRTQNLLRRHDVTTWADLAGLSVYDLGQFRGAGAQTVLDLACLAVAAVGNQKGSGAPVVEEPLTLEQDEALPPQREPLDPAVARITDGLRTLAAWALRERQLDEFKGLVQPAAGLQLPEPVAALWHAVAGQRLEDVADPDLVNADVAELSAALLDRFAGAQRVILEQRLLSSTPATLDQVGQQVGLTRERVRQLQTKLIEHLTRSLTERQFLPLTWRSADLADTLRSFAPADAPETVQAIDRACRSQTDEGASELKALLLYLAGPFNLRDGWHIRRGSEFPDGRALESAADASRTLSFETIDEWLDANGINTLFRSVWLQHTGRFRVMGDRVAVWSGSVVDKCVTLLAMRGSPCTVESLLDDVGEGHSPRGVRNRFFEDPRLMRVNKNDWALRAWDLEEYTGIAEEIAQRIVEWGGSARISDLVDELVRLFGVSAASVRVYVEAPMFVVEGGVVRLRREDEAFQLASGLSRARGCFRLDASRISYLVTVDKDVVRGSGRQCPEQFAAALGVRPGQPQSFSAADGTVAVTWPATSGLGPSLGSVRGLADDVGAAEGDFLRLEFDVVEKNVVGHLVTRALLDAASSDEAVRMMSGLDLGADQLAAVARAIDVAAADVFRVLRQRGDDRLADLLPRPVADEALQQALAELAGTLDELD
ncbi:MAG TPA: sigma factor-like helix-turn-helix DNA-binding protein [Mycobacteriales bacterium]|nr:sigma factor-like helix-turn-helix DNA-binding protein [Mycobacteriales bacterium]